MIDNYGQGRTINQRLEYMTYFISGDFFFQISQCILFLSYKKNVTVELTLNQWYYKQKATSYHLEWKICLPKKALKVPIFLAINTSSSSDRSLTAIPRAVALSSCCWLSVDVCWLGPPFSWPNVSIQIGYENKNEGLVYRVD